MAVKALFDKMCEKSEGIDNSEFVYIEHADCEADALTLKQKIEEHFGYKNIIINEMSPIIGAHVGPECLTLFISAKTSKNNRLFSGKDKQKTVKLICNLFLPHKKPSLPEGIFFVFN